MREKQVNRLQFIGFGWLLAARDERRRRGRGWGLLLRPAMTQQVGDGGVGAVEERPPGTMRGRDGHPDVVATKQRAGENGWTVA